MTVADRTQVVAESPIPEDQVDAISVIDKTLDNIEGLDADWTSPEVVELLQDLRDRIVRGYVAPQEPSECLCYGADGVTEPKCPACSSKVAPSPDREKLIARLTVSVDPLTATCSECGSKPGKRCYGNGEMRRPHPSRETRAERELRIEAADALAAPVAADEAKLAEAKYSVDSIHQIHGESCLCGFSSARSRSRTEHITQALAELLGGGER